MCARKKPSSQFHNGLRKPKAWSCLAHYHQAVSFQIRSGLSSHNNLSNLSNLSNLNSLSNHNSLSNLSSHNSHSMETGSRILMLQHILAQ